MKNKKDHIVGTVPKLTDRKIGGRGKLDTPNTQIHDRSHFLAWARYCNKIWPD